MHAELTDGTIIELTQDCACLSHTGPHWLHMDELTREKNREALDRTSKMSAQDIDAVQAIQCRALFDHFAKVEIIRLDTKLREMTSRGIKRIIRPGQPLETTPDEPAEGPKPPSPQAPESPETPYQRRADGRPLYFSTDRAWQPIDQYALDAYGLIPEAKDGLFQDGRIGKDWWATPSRIIGWSRSTAFNCWSALVEFPDGHQVWTYPKTY